MITTGFCLNGISLSAQFRKRVKALEQSFAAITAFIRRLKATLAPPDELLNSFCREQAELPDFFILAKRLTDEYGFCFAWKSGIEKSTLCLEKSDRLLLSRLGEIIGKSDIETQLSQLELLAEQLKGEISKAKQESDDKSRLCQTLWTMAGAAFSVLLL